MKLALECPTDLMKDIQPLADFDWILTHLVLEDKVYARHYQESTNFKVLDNSVNELLEPCSLGEMERAAGIVNPDLIVPPDFLGDSLETESTLMKALTIWPKEKILPCVQGEDLAHATNCVDFILRLGFGRIAVPYDITCKRTDSLGTMAESRLKVVSKIISMVPADFQIHLLGMTTLEELTKHNRGWVKSIDTGVPILYGLNCKRLDEPWEFKKDKPTMAQMERSPAGFRNDKLSSVFWNIAYLRTVLGGRGCL